ncbi:MAG: class I SAM-dependent methyltransferase, partial [Acidothermales bacterium]|nr:class I SAM-dependent methyltransferase [Acidothermales bacterium]
SVLLAEDGHRVTGVDQSPAMLERASDKAAAAGVAVEFRPGDAAAPPLADGAFDVVFSRHVVWALPDPGAALARWVSLLAPAGRLVLVEGRWSTGAGLTGAELVAAVEPHAAVVEVRPLPDPVLWGGPITDERYAVVAARRLGSGVRLEFEHPRKAGVGLEDRYPDAGGGLGREGAAYHGRGAPADRRHRPPTATAVGDLDVPVPQTLA